MVLFSPYQKDVLLELQTVYKLDSLDALLDLVTQRLESDYGLHVVVSTVHVAYGLTLALETAQGRCFLKFWSSRNQPELETVFAFLHALNQQAIPAPKVLPRLDGKSAANWLDGSDYDSVYLMQAAKGRPLEQTTPTALDSLAETLAHWHRVGLGFWVGQPLDFVLEVRQNLPSIVVRLSNQPTAQRIAAWLERQPILPLPSRRTHGDFRLCHVFFVGEVVSGVIDADTSQICTRLLDLAQAVVSHPDPARCGFLLPAQALWLLEAYQKLAPLEPAEHQALPVVLLYTALEQWAESNHQDDAAMATLSEALFIALVKDNFR
jgi:Ser/Thr protein kinase RdoA (MazF antagonist)